MMGRGKEKQVLVVLRLISASRSSNSDKINLNFMNLLSFYN